MTPTLPLPPARDVAAAEGFVRDHLGALVDGEVIASPRFRGGQMAADAVLASLDVTGYAAARNEVWPAKGRGASAVSPYVRHGLLSLPLLWDAVADAPARDRQKYRDELLWQEYARHLYARLGRATRRGLRRELAGTAWREAGSAARPEHASKREAHGRAAAGEGSAGIPAEPSPPAVGGEPGDAGDANEPGEAGEPGAPGAPETAVWDPSMACLEVNAEELATDGYLVNQTRMWLASHWAVRAGVDWRAGEDVFFRHLLDGSRAANRAGWQWTIGTGSGKPYGFSRWQVEKRAPGLCDTCPLADACPIEDWPEDPPLTTTEEHPKLRRDDDPEATAGPRGPRLDIATTTATASGPRGPRLDIDTATATGAGPTGPTGPPGDAGAEVVWLTAESLGDDDPALAAHPDLPAVFVLDAPLLARLRLSGKRLVFLVECLADLAERRDVTVHLGDPVEVLADRPLATTYAPVPGWTRRAEHLDVVATHPWPWLVRPHGGSVASFSAWRKAARGGRR